jgi:pimeloyl-ACP methyl ester carboxylesterase
LQPFLREPKPVEQGVMERPHLTLQLKTVEVAYLDDGDRQGTPLLFLHGFPDDPSTWDAVIARPDLPRFRLIRPWQRGFGNSRVLDESVSGAQTAALANDVLDLANALNLERFFLIGHDWGSRAAHSVAVLAPERVLGLVALATPYGSPAVSPEIRLRQEQAFWYQWFFQTPHGRAVFRANPRAFCNYLWQAWSPGWNFDAQEYEAAARSFHNPQFVDTVIHYYAHRWKNAPGREIYEHQQEILDKSPAIKVPTIFACGTSDACNLVEAGRGNESFYHGPYRRVEIPGVGHFPHRQFPDVVAQLVREAVCR